jgi:hypothetical protein
MFINLMRRHYKDINIDVCLKPVAHVGGTDWILLISAHRLESKKQSLVNILF